MIIVLQVAVTLRTVIATPPPAQEVISTGMSSSQTLAAQRPLSTSLTEPPQVWFHEVLETRSDMMR